MKEASWLSGIQKYANADSAHKALNAGCEFLRNNPIAADLAPKTVMAGCSMYQNYRARTAPQGHARRLKKKKRKVKYG